MGRWDMPDKGTAATAIYSDGKFIGYGAYNQYAIILTDAHNADVDAYEARISELAAELARVKAESLRVVVDGEAVVIMDCDSKYFAHGGRVYEIPDGEYYGVLVGHEGPHYTGFYGDSATIVHPVRLERWEDGE